MKKAENKMIFSRVCRLLKDVDEAGFARLCECMHVKELHLKNKETFIRIPFDRQVLADFLCVDRSALSAELSKLRRERKVESVKNHFKLLD